MRIALVIATLFYSAFGFLDALMIPEMKHAFWLIRFAVVAPVAAVVLLFSFTAAFEKFAQPALALVCLVGGIGVEGMVILADSVAMYSYYTGIILIFITIYTFMRIRFVWATGCGWLLVIFYEVGAIFLSDTPDTLVIHNNFFFITANVLCMLAGYAIELNSRKLFITNLQLEETKNQVVKDNEELDLRVYERTLELNAANKKLNLEIIEKVASEKTKLLLEKQINTKQKLESLGTLAGGIAHDFNNILAAVIGYAELTQEGLDRGSLNYSNLQQILAAGTRGKELTGQILAFSRQTNSALMPVLVSPMIDGVISMVQATIPKNITLTVTGRTKSCVRGDEGQLHRIILNLCTNAYQAITPQKGTIEVHAQDVSIEAMAEFGEGPLDPGEYVKISISDTGPGIDPEFLDQIYDPFYTTKAPDEGTGMGLSVVHGIVTKHKGQIRVSSELDVGTTFEVFLPIENEPLIEEIATVVSEKRGHGLVMLVEDEPEILFVLEKHIEALGYQTKGFTNGREAIAEFYKSPNLFDLVMTDFNMPEITGLELGKIIKSVRPNIPIILCTGHSGNLDQDILKTGGITFLLEKPARKAEIAAAISKILNQN